MSTAPCPKCKVNLSVRKPGRGKTPVCEACRRVRVNPKHYDANGVRFGTPGRKVFKTCKYCGTPYEKRRNELRDPVCLDCLDKHTEVVEPARAFRRTQVPSADREYRRRALLNRRLRKLGLPPDWLEKQGGKCGICGATEPGGKGAWQIDHDHTCCSGRPRGGTDVIGCAQCVRGILCFRCNVGLGNFRDNPTLLRRAIEWVTHPPRTQDGGCGICGAGVPGGHGRWNTDHDHTCCKNGCPKCIRGRLCQFCNVGLGQFRDEPKFMLAAIAWVKRSFVTQAMAV